MSTPNNFAQDTADNRASSERTAAIKIAALAFFLASAVCWAFTSNNAPVTGFFVYLTTGLVATICLIAFPLHLLEKAADRQGKSDMEFLASWSNPLVTIGSTYASFMYFFGS